MTVVQTKRKKRKKNIIIVSRQQKKYIHNCNTDTYARNPLLHVMSVRKNRVRGRVFDLRKTARPRWCLYDRLFFLFTFCFRLVLFLLVLRSFTCFSFHFSFCVVLPLRQRHCCSRGESSFFFLFKSKHWRKGKCIMLHKIMK